MTTPVETLDPKPAMSLRLTTVIGLYLIVTFFLQIGLLIEFWPQAIEGSSQWKNTYALFDWPPCREPPCMISDDGRLLVLVLLAGGAGAVTHGIRSFTVRLGNASLNAGWGWWYALRPFEGAVIALAFYLVIRGGLMGTNGSGGGTSVVSPYAITGISVLVGMFSQQAMAKLKDVAETFFSKVDADPPKPLPAPTIAKAEPASLPPGTAATRIAVTGTGFTKDTKAHVNGQARDTTFQTSTALFVTLTAEDLKEAGTLKITVVTPGRGESKPADVRVGG